MGVPERGVVCLKKRTRGVIRTISIGIVALVLLLAIQAYGLDTPTPKDAPKDRLPGTNPGTEPGTNPGTEPASDPWEGKTTEIRTATFSRGTTGTMSNGEIIWFTDGVGLPVRLNQARILSIEGSFEILPAEDNRVEFAAINIVDLSRPLMQQCVAFQYWNASELTSPIYYSWSWDELYQGAHDMVPPPQPWETRQYPPFCDKILLRLWGPILPEPDYGPYPRNWHITVTYEVIA